MPLKPYKNLFLIYPSGAGGNHLANMLSLTPEFTDRYVSDDYLLSMYHNYTDPHTISFHYTDIQNLKSASLAENGERYLNSNLKNIWCSHYDEFLYSNRDPNFPILPKLTDRIFFLFNFPPENSLAFKRIYFGPWSSLGNGMPPEFVNPKYYEKEWFCKPKFLPLDDPINPKTVFPIDSEKFVLSYDYISTTIYDILNIELPEICRLMHHIWLKRITSFVNDKSVDFNSEFSYTIREP